MTKEERAIEEAAIEYLQEYEQYTSYNIGDLLYAYVSGAKSDPAKEYWQKGMYSEEEVKELIYRFHMAAPTNGFIDEDYWFSQNKKK